MRLDTLRIIVGFLIVISHISSFGLILLNGDLAASERAELSLIITPLFAVYVTAVVRRIVTLTVYDETPVHPALTVLSISTAVIFAIAIPSLILAFQYHNIETFQDLKTFVGIVETALGLYTGAVIERLFGGATPGGTT